MNITKIETNYKRKLFLSKTENIKYKKYNPNIINQIINIYPEITYDKILGFGGAITEASGFALSELPLDKQKKFIDEYFSESGLGYKLCRLPIGSTDFSLKSYSYSNKPDLSDFSIEKDERYIIPMVKKALTIKPNLTFLSSPWSPPRFMKSNKMLILGGKLLENYKSNYAQYLSKYIEAYKNAGININYITVQNEPSASQLWESCIYSPEEEISFVIKYLAPTFEKNNIKTKILIWDHNKEKIFSRVSNQLTSETAKKYISGIAFHYYTGDHFENLELLRKLFPEKILIHTEGCTGYSNFNPNDEVHNAELYGHEIIGDLNHGTNAYIDWNILLDNKGGPNHKLNYCNSPIMLNSEKNDYIKNLTYYYIGHFSKYIKQNALRIAYSKYTDSIEVTGFKNPDNSLSIVLMNKNNYNKEYNLCIKDITIHDNLDSHAIVTYIIKE